jgi:predicted amidophosphoribosyltransferase
MKLPNEPDSWVWGESLNRYTMPYSETHGVPTKTPEGQWVHDYKYASEMDLHERTRITREFTNRVFELIKRKFSDFDKTKIPFDVCISPPGNRDIEFPLPNQVCKLLCRDHSWMKLGSHAISKTRVSPVLKNVDPENRPQTVKGLYRVDLDVMPLPTRGILIIDDVFETGSTLRSLCEALEAAYPLIPRYVVTLTHLYSAERSQ